MPAGKCSSTLGAHQGCNRCALFSNTHARKKSKHRGTHTITPITVAHLAVCASALGATHVSESVPGSVLAVLSRGARPFLVSGESRACAQQESHDRQQEEEHLLRAKRHRTYKKKSEQLTRRRRRGRGKSVGAHFPQL